jgi:Pin2-interacting protein X1
MLMKMGWSEGKGLGKDLQGTATHVKVTKKTDSAGEKTINEKT